MVVVVVVVVVVVYLSTGLSAICKIENEAFYSARLPQFLNLTTSKAQQFCETSSFSHKLATSKTTQFCKISFKNGKLNAELTASYR